MNTISLILLLVAFAAILRVVPGLLSPAGAGVDHWFWKKYIETLRSSRQFPPVLPQYLLDQAQWYPPLFPLLMMHIPTKIFDRFNQMMAIGFDLLRMLMLLLIAYWLTDGDERVVLLAGLIYATTPIQISYNFQLNPRGLAALFLDGVLILLLWYYSYHGPWWSWLLVIAISGLILLTHKMTTQLFWFICLCCSFAYQDIRLFLLIPASIITALLMSKGFYWKVLIAHLDIVRFWKSNWRWIGADAVRESPVYGEENYHRPEKLHKSGMRGFVWYCFLLFGFNPASWIACLLMFERVFIEPHVLIYSSWLIFWLLIPCALSALTTFVPVLRCIGAGYLYLYNTSLITSLLLAMAYEYTRWATISTLVYATALIFNLLGVFLFYRKFFRNKRARIDQAFQRMLDRLAQLPKGTVWCIPSGWHEPVAYKTQHDVLWGAHGYGFKLLTPTFPRIMVPLTRIMKEYNVKYLLTLRGQLTKAFVADIPADTTVIVEDDYMLYVLPQENSSA